MLTHCLPQYPSSQENKAAKNKNTPTFIQALLVVHTSKFLVPNNGNQQNEARANDQLHHTNGKGS